VTTKLILEIKPDDYRSYYHAVQAAAGSLILTEDASGARHAGLVIDQPFAGVIALDGAQTGRVLRLPSVLGFTMSLDSVAELVIEPMLGEREEVGPEPAVFELWDDNGKFVGLEVEAADVSRASGADTVRWMLVGQAPGSLARLKGSRRLVGALRIRRTNIGVSPLAP
jgi:hypothetical protein